MKDFYLPSLAAGIIIAGMTLTYYRMALIGLSLLPGVLIFWLLDQRHKEPRSYRTLVKVVVAIGISSIAFLIPWLPRLTGSNLSGMLVTGMQNTPAIQASLVELREWNNLHQYLPLYLAASTAIGILWAMWRKRWDILAIGGWIVFIQLYFLGRMVPLPGANMIQVFMILIWLYIPASIVCGWFIGEIAGWIANRYQQIGPLGLAASLFVIGLVGANQARLIARPAQYNLVTKPDLRAMKWIEQNVPDKSVFLVEGSRIYNGRSVVGTDAGWWIPLLAGRRNTMPPQYALLNEMPVSDDQNQSYVDLVAALEVDSFNEKDVLKRLCENRISHIYIGQRWGNVGAATRQLFIPAAMIELADFPLIYHQDQVYIFELNPTTCKK